jgi:subtilisin family serine protease/outer membrane protein assembly factor BamB
MQRRASRTGLRGLSRRTLAVAASAAIVVAIAPSGSAAPDEREAETYIVQMALDPVVAYDGDVDDLPATEPRPGRKIDPRSPAVVDYVDHLKEKHRAALARVGGDDPLYDYVYSFDGFAAELTEAQATELAMLPDVVAVTEDEMYEVDTSSTPTFLDLDAPGGLWDQLGGPTGSIRDSGAGEQTIIGVIDTGIWPASQSFSDRDAQDRLIYAPLRGFHGKCDSSETVGDDSWDANLCNQKLVAARHFNAGWGGDEGIAEQRPWEFASPRDYNGHGTHTTSTAGGNHGVALTGAAEPFGSISGIAPRARIAAYKALWSTEDAATAGGFGSDLVAAIDQAVADGVDVINYSISGVTFTFLDPVEVAFLNAANAGVFVAASAGNDGPRSGTVAHPSPWITTVAAGTHSRSPEGSVTLGNGDTYTGASIATSAVGPAPLVDAADAGLPGASSFRAAQCWSAADNGGDPVLDPAAVDGKIVICDRGSTARVNKSTAVAEAGGIGMIMANTGEDSLNADFHSVPTVHIAHTDRDAVKAYAATDGSTATIDKAMIRDDAPAPFTAAFSSRGPLAGGAGDVLKPDLIAPGQDILAAVAPPGHNGQDFNFSSGTSMSAPHVAGLAALLADLHPGWSPMMIKSALMTTGSDVLDGDAVDPSVIFSQGAGHVTPNRAADPGLVYDSDVNDWLAFLCGVTTGVVETTCDALEDAGYSLDPSDLNGPSIAVGWVPGTQTVTRKVTNVSDAPSTYTSSVTGLDGVDVTIEPSTITLDPGESESIAITLTQANAPVGTHLGGYLTWSDGTHDVRSPIVIRVGRNSDEDWSARYGGPPSQFGESSDEAHDILLDPDGERVYVSGSSLPALPGTLQPDFATAAYDPATGEELWAVRYEGPGNGADDQAGFGISPDGSKVFVAGLSTGADTGNDFATIAYDAATGDELWVARHDGPIHQSDNANALVVSPDGGTVYVSGLVTTDFVTGGTTTDYGTIAYDADTGDELWVTLFNGPGDGTDDPRAIDVSPDGSTVVVTGQSRGIDTGFTDFGTVAYDAATGEELWNALYNGPATGFDIDIGGAVTAGADGTVIVAGSSSGSGTGSDWATIAYDISTGEELWVERYDATGSTDVPRAVTMTPDRGTVVVTGNSWGDGTGSDYATIAYDAATGDQRWVARHDGSASGLDIAWDIAVTPDGGHVVVTGQSTESGTGNDYATIAYDAATGEQVWTGLYDRGGAGDIAQAVAVDATPEVGIRVFVTGQTAIQLGPVTSDVDYGTLAYFDPWGSP